MRRRNGKLVLSLLLSVAVLSMNISFAYAEERTLSDVGATLENPVSENPSSSTGISSTTSSQVRENADSETADGQNGMGGADSGTEGNSSSATEENNSVTEGSTDNTGTGETETGSTEPGDGKTENGDNEAGVGTEGTENKGDGSTENTDSTEDSGTSGDETEGKDGATEGTENKDDATESTGDKDGATEGTEDKDGVTEETENKDNAAADGAEGAEGEITEEPENAFINKDGEEVFPSTLVGVDYNTVAGSYDGETNVLKQYAVSDTYAKDMIMDSYIDENGNLVMVISQGAPVAETQEKPESIVSNVLSALEPGMGLESEQGGSGSAPPIDGSGSGWDDIPVSYEYNWDNSANCWQWGNWVTDPVTGEQVCYKTEEGTYDSNVRHEMQMYSDGQNVYLKITYATIYGTHSNGDDFNFYIDGVGTKFGITQANGQTLTGWSPEAGTYVVDVRNGDSGSSYSIVDGAVAYYHVTDNNINNSLELKIPMEAFKAQNGAVNLDNYSMIQFFTPNLMYNRLTAAGSSSGAVPFATVVFLLVPASYVMLKRKDKEMAFA